MQLNKRVWMVVAAGLLTAFGVAAVRIGDGLQFGFCSQSPKFARINVSDDGGKWLLVIFDETKGTDSGYDQIHVVPQNFGSGMKTTKANSRKPVGTGAVGRVAFAPLAIGELVSSAGTGQGLGSHLSDLAFSVGAGEFIAKCTYRVRANGVSWEYIVEKPLSLASEAERAPVTAFAAKPALAIEATPAEQGKKKTLAISATMMPVCSANGKPIEVEMVVKNAKGTVIRRLNSNIEELTKREDGTSLCKVELPGAGAYRVQAAAQAGPMVTQLLADITVDVP